MATRRPSGSAPDPKPSTPTPQEPLLTGVTPELVESIRHLGIPELFPFATATSEQALKQWGFAYGVIWFKQKLAQALAAQQRKDKFDPNQMDIHFKQ
jgi:hypothetical protein